MLEIDRRSIQNFDWLLLGLVALLVGLGLVNLLSATIAGVGAGVSETFRRQLFSLGVAALAMIGACVIDYRRFARLAMPLYVASLLFLLLPVLVSPVTRGAQAWLFDGRIQPSEFAKIGLILALARYFQRNPPTEITRLSHLGMPLVIVAIPVGLPYDSPTSTPAIAIPASRKWPSIQPSCGSFGNDLSKVGAYITQGRGDWRFSAGGKIMNAGRPATSNRCQSNFWS